MKAEIITIGDELLIGQVIDTNSAWMGRRLNENGIWVTQISSVSDNKQHILNALKEAHNRADIILITGGLGPTKDDITKNTLCEYFGVGLVENKEALENVKHLFRRLNRPLLDVNLKQAELPANCEAIQNANGTAPGMWFNHQGKIYISMPGVPHEMMEMMDGQVLPRLAAEFKMPFIIHRNMLTAGIGESFLAEMITPVEDSLPAHIKLAYLPKSGQVRLRLSGTGSNKEVLENEISSYANEIKKLIKTFLVSDVDIPLEEVIMNRLITAGQTISIAESCTGGYISHLFTAIPGSSAAFEGGVVCYSYAVKEKIVGVSKQTLEKYGAVSEETVAGMLTGVMGNFGTDYAIACSGIAGPGGGTPDKPVGMVWIGVADRNEQVIRKYQFGSKRMQNIERTAAFAMMMLFQLMEKNEINSEAYKDEN